MIYDYTKSVLERVSFDPVLFTKELKKAIKNLLPYEVEQLKKWFQFFTSEHPELKQCLSLKTNICRRGFVFIGLGFKCLPVSNALAYFAVALVATKIVLFCWFLEEDE